jgi:hypothetical protein
MNIERELKFPMLYILISRTYKRGDKEENAERSNDFRS